MGNDGDKMEWNDTGANPGNAIAQEQQNPGEGCQRNRKINRLGKSECNRK